MKGTITFNWSDGYNITKVIGASVRGLIWKGERPVSYTVHIDEQTIMCEESHNELSQFARWWLENVSFVLGRRKK